jgi:hypothetical protein
LKEWREKKYYKTDATMQLRDCPSDVDRVDSETLTVEDFIEKY